jgi:hypothetical protein
VTALLTRGKVLLVAVGLAAVVAGCSQEQPGTPSGSSGSTPGTSVDSTPTSTRGTTAPASNIDPCELIPDAEATTLGLATPGKARTVAGLTACSWQAGGDFGVIVGVAKTGIDGVNGQSVPLAKHKAVQSTESGGFGGCGVFVEISKTSSVIVAAVLSGGKPAAEACPRSVEVAKIVDSALP